MILQSYDSVFIRHAKRKTRVIIPLHLVQEDSVKNEIFLPFHVFIIICLFISLFTIPFLTCAVPAIVECIVLEAPNTVEKQKEKTQSLLFGL